MGTNGVGQPSLSKAPGKTNGNSTINRETGVTDRRHEHSTKKTMFLSGCFLAVFAMAGPVLGVVSQKKPQSPPVAGSALQEKPQPSPDDLFVPPDSPIPDIDFSILNQKFRLMDLARDIAESMKNEPTETKFEKIMQMPSGLRRFIMWSLPEEEIIQHFTHTMEKEVAPKYPSQAADVKSLHQKIVEMIPAMRQAKCIST
jgi:hypothetical protein